MPWFLEYIDLKYEVMLTEENLNFFFCELQLMFNCVVSKEVIKGRAEIVKKIE